MNPFIQPNWPAPRNVKALTTLCKNDTNSFFNLANHVGDNIDNVLKNRLFLKTHANLPSDPIWIQQTHSAIALEATPENKNKEADASYTQEKNRVCVVLTADCLPILVCNKSGTQIAAIHAGWKGLAKGIVENTIQALDHLPEDLLIWLGPGICQTHYEVGNEVRDAFLAYDPNAEKAFLPSPENRWLADLYEVARLRLKKMGIESVYGGEFCTFEEKDLFFSARRDGLGTGRLATLIWME